MADPCPDCGGTEYVCTCHTARLEDTAARAMNTLRVIALTVGDPSGHIADTIKEIEVALEYTHFEVFPT